MLGMIDSSKLRERVLASLARQKLKGEPRFVEAWLRVAHKPEDLLVMEEPRFDVWIDVAAGCAIAEGREASERLAKIKGVQP